MFACLLRCIYSIFMYYNFIVIEISCTYALIVFISLFSLMADYAEPTPVYEP